MNSNFSQIVSRVDEIYGLLNNVMVYALFYDAARDVAVERVNDIATMVEAPIKCLEEVLRQQKQAAGV